LELRRAFPDANIATEVGIIREKEKMRYLFEQHQPDIVFHAAAHKHVPLMEHNTEEAVKNNVFGTKNIAELACEHGVDKFILVSTDKAVNPTNIMGATKRLAEMIVEELNRTSTKTKLCAVRFGNVLASNGSVVPIFKELLKNNLNLTLTHKDVTRYFMTIPEAAQLVLAAGSLSEGGEVFVLDMGEPVRIYDLARRMIELSGVNVEIEIVGLRPGEKLYEELLYDVSQARRTVQDKLYIASIQSDGVGLEAKLNHLDEVIHSNDSARIVATMKEIVDTYKSPEEINAKRGN
jgi:FlaA1/EpsC-like NDP-sugar epimerase